MRHFFAGGNIGEMFFGGETIWGKKRFHVGSMDLRVLEILEFCEDFVVFLHITRVFIE